MPHQALHDFPEPPRPQPTGRTLVLFHSQADLTQVKQTLSKSTGAPVRDRRDFAGSATALRESVDLGEAVIFHRQNVAILPKNGQSGIRALEADDSVEAVRPEFYMFAIDEFQRRYAEWVRQGLQMLIERPGDAAELRTVLQASSMTPAAFADDNNFTWGLHAIGAATSKYTGAGIRVAVLDTGLDLTHPDVVGRKFVTKSFVEGEDVQDRQGHGTHTAGTIAGPAQSSFGRRYGVAPDVELYVGKILNNSGVGREAEIIDGMNWAIDEKCAVISMSLGRATFPGEKPDPLYERTGAAALREDCLIIAAAGNESARTSEYIAPVSAPANSPSIMAVAAVDSVLGVAPFSCGGVTPGGGEVDISGPGVSVYSSSPMPQQSRLLNGTSMACPHVAGAAALWAQSDPSLRGQKLWDALVASVRRLSPPRDLGSGLVQVPGMASA